MKVLFGFTSRDNLNYLVDDIPNKKVYVYPIYHNLHLKAFSLLGGESLMFFCSQILDKVVITFSGLLTGEILYNLRINKEKFNCTLISISAFSFFLTSPWSYRMLLAPWQEVYFLLFFTINNFSFPKRKI